MEDPEVRSTIAIMHDLLSAYRLQAWDAAVQAVDALSGRRLSHLDLETFRSLYRGRIEQFHSDPQAHGWDGVHSTETKKGAADWIAAADGCPIGGKVGPAGRRRRGGQWGVKRGSAPGGGRGGRDVEKQGGAG